MPDLDKQAMMMAVANGIKQAFDEAGLSEELLSAAISKGVADAIWRIATQDSEDPTNSFYSAIQAGVRDVGDR